MPKDYTDVSAKLKNLFHGLHDLRQSGVLVNQKDFTCQIGEWLVAELFDGKRSANSIEQGWDVKVGDKYIQVKAHAKASTNGNRFSSITIPKPAVRVDELVTVIFTNDYRLNTIYRTPWATVLPFFKPKGDKYTVSWSVQNKVDLRTLKNQSVVRLFS